MCGSATEHDAAEPVTEPHPVETALGYVFRDARWLKAALRHRSAARRTAIRDAHNERLEFLGDAVIDLALRTYLYRRYPHAAEGRLTQWRARLASRGTLAGIARRLGLAAHLERSLPPDHGHPTQQERLLADGVEALLGAVYCDADYETAEAVFLRIAGPDLARIESDPYQGNDKNALQEMWQRKTGALPEYVLIHRTGPDHAPFFEMEVRLAGEPCAVGTGWSKREASQNAARRALERFRNDPEWAAALMARASEEDSSG